MQQQPPATAASQRVRHQALMVRLIAICLGLIPLLGLGAITGGIVAVTFGLLGIGRARRGVASNEKMSITGLIAGVLAGALGIWGLVIVGNALNELNSTINGTRPIIGVPAGVPAAPGGASAADAESTTGAFDLAVLGEEADPGRPVVGVEHREPVQLQRAGEREDVTHVLVDDQHGGIGVFGSRRLPGVVTCG
jgi:hypothetical protein